MTTDLFPLFPEHKAAIIANVAVAMERRLELNARIVAAEAHHKMHRVLIAVALDFPVMTWGARVMVRRVGFDWEHAMNFHGSKDIDALVGRIETFIRDDMEEWYTAMEECGTQ